MIYVMKQCELFGSLWIAHHSVGIVYGLIILELGSRPPTGPDDRLDLRSQPEV